MRSRSQPSVLAFLAQDAEGRAFCSSNAQDSLTSPTLADHAFRLLLIMDLGHEVGAAT